MDHVLESQVTGIDQDAGFFAGFTDGAADDRFARIQVARGRAELPVRISGVSPFEQKDPPVRPPHQDVDIHNAAITIRHKASSPAHQFRLAHGQRRTAGTNPVSRSRPS